MQYPAGLCCSAQGCLHAGTRWSCCEKQILSWTFPGRGQSLQLLPALFTSSILRCQQCKTQHNITSHHGPVMQDIQKLFLYQDTIDKDQPAGIESMVPTSQTTCVGGAGCWSVAREQGGDTILLRNLFWPGQVAYHRPQTTTFGHFYSGTGEKTADLLFML